MICIHYNNGQVLQGIVLAFGDRMVRVAVKGSGDAAEYRLIGQVWVSEDCEVVKLVFTEWPAPLNSDAADLLDFLLQLELPPVSTLRLM